MRTLSAAGLIGLFVVGQGSACAPGPEEKPEVCDGLDNDLDEEVDEDASDALLWYADSDGDGYGDDAHTLLACAAPSGYSAVGGDCALDDPSRSPGAAEDCAASADADCDGLAGCEDGDCMTDAACTEDCADGVDDDGDGLTDCWDDDCWPACGAIVRSSLKGGRMSMSTEQLKGSHSVGFQRVNGTAWSLSGHVEVVHATGSLACDWTAHSARFWTRARQYLTWPHGSSADWKMASSSSGGHDSSVVTLSAGCPAPWAVVLPPTLSPGYRWPETPSGPWYSGEIAAKKVIYPYSYSDSLYGVTIFYAVDTLSPATATWSY
ncbi:MAG: hypothetical protein RIT28_4564 [Pseudomonadota bacterium]